MSGGQVDENYFDMSKVFYELNIPLVQIIFYGTCLELCTWFTYAVRLVIR